MPSRCTDCSSPEESNNLSNARIPQQQVRNVHFAFQMFLDSSCQPCVAKKSSANEVLFQFNHQVAFRADSQLFLDYREITGMMGI